STLDNIGGQNEKWLYDAAGQYYFILPTGELFVGGSITSLGNVGVSYYNDPTLLTDPPADPHATFIFTGRTLTITRDPAWIGSMVITVMVSNGLGSDSITFDLFVTA